MSTSDDLALAHRLADVADAIALRHFTAVDTAWRIKEDGSPVSDADEEIELALRHLIRRERPAADAVLGEEFCVTTRSASRSSTSRITPRDGRSRPDLRQRPVLQARAPAIASTHASASSAVARQVRSTDPWALRR